MPTHANITLGSVQGSRTLPITPPHCTPRPLLHLPPGTLSSRMFLSLISLCWPTASHLRHGADRSQLQSLKRHHSYMTLLLFDTRNRVPKKQSDREINTDRGRGRVYQSVASGHRACGGEAGIPRQSKTKASRRQATRDGPPQTEVHQGLALLEVTRKATWISVFGALHVFRWKSGK